MRDSHNKCKRIAQEEISVIEKEWGKDTALRCKAEVQSVIGDAYDEFKYKNDVFAVSFVIVLILFGPRRLSGRSVVFWRV